jgi:hypothetical protein
LGSTIVKDGIYTLESLSMIVKSKAAFNKERALFASKLDLNFRKKLVECYIWSIPLCGAEI